MRVVLDGIDGVASSALCHASTGFVHTRVLRATCRQPLLPLNGSRADGCSGTWPAVPATARPPHGAPGEEPARDACKWWAPEGGVARNGEQWMNEEVSATDAALRQRIHEFCVHIPVRQDPRSAATGSLPGLPIRWQSCPCEDNSGEVVGCDVSRQFDLCIICFRATAGGTSRWSWLACEDCRAINRIQSGPVGFPPVRAGTAQPDERNRRPRGYSAEGQQAQIDRLMAFLRGGDGLRGWRSRGNIPCWQAEFDP